MKQSGGARGNHTPVQRTVELAFYKFSLFKDINIWEREERSPA